MKIMIFDQGDPVSRQMISKAAEVFAGAEHLEIVAAETKEMNHEIVADMLVHAVCSEKPEVLLIGSTTLGEEVSAALGVRLKTGVAAHCVDIRADADGNPIFMIPAFGGKAIGEIMVPGAGPGKPAIATVKPDVFQDTGFTGCRTISMEAPAAGNEPGGFRITDLKPAETKAADLSKARLILCGGYGLGSEESWQKLTRIAEALGGAAGCTRPVVDAGWGADEEQMIGTSGRSVKPEVYVGFGISGAAHHLCGIKDAGTIINVNQDRKAEAFAASDYIGEFDADKVLDALEKELDL
ncbi:MAG: electron transfer flavoprotein subunit alpha/FixB family protein [Bacillota bacterium]|nr:electron transfer flavoprotein subunit alpha/FixB family protein [Bacillota bacterium]